MMDEPDDGQADVPDDGTDGNNSEFADTETVGVSVPLVANYEMKGQRPQGLPLGIVREVFLNVTGGWPKAAGGLLFVEGTDQKPLYLDTPTKLFGWARESIVFDWRRLADAASQEQLFENLAMHTEQYDEIATVPHWPPDPRTYYMHPEIPNTDGSCLNAFLDFFKPHTATDRELIRGFVLSLFWGGPCGKRPAWLVTSATGDVGQGRGVGKSMLVQMVGELAGGAIEVSPHEDIIAIKKRLLSTDARRLRLARIDNLKTHRFSWADLEGLITAPVISGHQMYRGEGRRPNTLTWSITLNGASLSKDMAQRCVIIKVDRPHYAPHWEEQVRDFVESHRWEIIGDIALILGG